MGLMYFNLYSNQTIALRPLVKDSDQLSNENALNPILHKTDKNMQNMSNT